MPTWTDDLRAVGEALSAHVREAWPSVREVYWRRPLLDGAPLPYACLWLPEARGEWLSAQSIGRTMEWSVFGVFPLSSDASTPALLDAAERADELVRLLESSPVYAEVGMSPVVKDIRIAEQKGGTEDLLLVEVGFSCLVDRAWGQ